MTLPALEGRRWVALCALAVTLGCPQLAPDDFRGRERITGGTTGEGGADDAGSGGRDACGDAVGAGGRCDGGTGGTHSSTETPPSPDAGPDASEDSCAGTRGPNDACYIADPRVTTWSEARAACQLRGVDWDLATVRSLAENDFLLALTGYEVWLGATDEADEGVWIWVRDDAPFFEVETADAGAFPPWNAGEPNNLDNSDCLRMLATGLWADWECDEAKGHVCQQTAP
jgi:hypothetical protein